MRRVAHRVSLDSLLDVLNGRQRFMLPEGAQFVAIDIDHIQQDARLASSSASYDLVSPNVRLSEEPLPIALCEPAKEPTNGLDAQPEPYRYEVYIRGHDELRMLTIDATRGAIDPETQAVSFFDAEGKTVLLVAGSAFVAASKHAKPSAAPPIPPDRGR